MADPLLDLAAHSAAQLPVQARIHAFRHEMSSVDWPRSLPQLRQPCDSRRHLYDDLLNFSRFQSFQMILTEWSLDAQACLT